ncbi:MAG: SGNH/GDSL hydrolase family protein [Sciscionella sp.]
MARSARHRAARYGFGLILAIAMALVPALPAAAAQPVHTGTGYLALGDSVAFGYRPPQVTPPADYLNAANFVGYPRDLARHRGLSLSNASCPGETTASMITAGAQSNGCENSLGSPYGYRTVYPLHVDYSGTQLGYAVHYLREHPRTRLVTINIGANDMFLCQESTADQCTGSDFATALKQVSTNLGTIYAALRHDAHYHHKLVLVSYYSLDYRDAQQDAETIALNAALIAPTLRYRGTVADGFTAFLRAAASHGGDTCAAGLLVKLPNGTCNIHPSSYGHQVLARAIARVIR